MFLNVLVFKVLCYCIVSQSAFTFSKLTIETVEQGVKYVQSMLFHTLF